MGPLEVKIAADTKARTIAMLNEISAERGLNQGVAQAVGMMMAAVHMLRVAGLKYEGTVLIKEALAELKKPL